MEHGRRAGCSRRTARWPRRSQSHRPDANVPDNTWHEQGESPGLVHALPGEKACHTWSSRQCDRVDAAAGSKFKGDRGHAPICCKQGRARRSAASARRGLGARPLPAPLWNPNMSRKDALDDASARRAELAKLFQKPAAAVPVKMQPPVPGPASDHPAELVATARAAKLRRAEKADSIRMKRLHR